jgi:hypothetical protein
MERGIQGSFRLQLADERKLEDLRRKYDEAFRSPDPVLRLSARREMMREAAEEDSGWTKNLVTDYGRRLLASSGWGTGVNIFIHQATADANVRRNVLPFAYASQSPSQIQSPTVTTLDRALLLQTRLVTFGVPAVARTINAVGLTFDGSVAVQNVSLILAHAKLSTPFTQSTSLVADVQYRVTWSLA